jgi:hypothetical protein
MLRLIPSAAAAAVLVSATAFASGYLEGVKHGPESFDNRWMAMNAQLGALRLGARQDRVAPPQPSASRTNTAIRTVGRDDGTIVYRDQNGRLLFRNDPASRTTTVMKGVVVPSANGGKQQPVRRNVVREKDEKLLEACEPAFSVVAAPSLAHIPGRCMA